MPSLPENWPGFDAPRYTPVPDDLFDIWLPLLTGAEVKVLLYVCRRTFGFKKDSDAISLSQICEGIVKRDGTRLDWGAGVAKSTAVRAVEGLVAKGLIITERKQSVEHGDEATIYSLKLRPTPVSENRTRMTENRTRVAENRTRSGPKTEHAPVRKPNTQETVVQDTEEQESGRDDFDVDEDEAPRSHEQTEQAAAPPSYSAWIAGVITDFSREMNDLANVAANVRRAANLWRESGLPEDAFVTLLQRAKEETRKAQPRGIGNKMTYLLNEVEKRVNPGNA